MNDCEIWWEQVRNNLNKTLTKPKIISCRVEDTRNDNMNDCEGKCDISNNSRCKCINNNETKIHEKFAQLEQLTHDFNEYKFNFEAEKLKLTRVIETNFKAKVNHIYPNGITLSYEDDHKFTPDELLKIGSYNGEIEGDYVFIPFKER